MSDTHPYPPDSFLPRPHVLAAIEAADACGLPQTLYKTEDYFAPSGFEAAGGSGASITHQERRPVLTVLPRRYYVPFGKELTRTDP